MIQQGNILQKSPGMLVLSNHQQDFILLRNLLCKYFPSPNQSQIHLDTKYYRANLQIVRRDWPSLQQIADLSDKTQQQLENLMNPEDKQSLLIMLVNDSSSFPSTMYDFVINKYNPENFILIVNTKTKNISWQDEEKISNEVNNFIEVIKQNLELLNSNPPERMKKGLLADSYEDGSIFNLLELIQTTSWPKIQRKVFDKKQNQKNSIPPEPSKPKLEEKEEKEEKGGSGQQMPQEYTDQQLQMQMNAFQNLMGQMLSLKSQSGQPSKLPDIERKRKAQDLMNKLMGGWM